VAYVDGHLLPGERVVHRAHLHKLIYFFPAVASVLFALGAVALYLGGTIEGAIALGIIAIFPVLIAYITYTSSEFAVTDKRVIIKVGFIQRRTMETMLSKVENISVEQGIFGRMLGFGTITVTGTGGTKETFANIADPLEFRRQVQGQVSAADDVRRSFVGAGEGYAGPPREERDCPYCAERILTRARLCKHCGREVEPLSAG